MWLVRPSRIAWLLLAVLVLFVGCGTPSASETKSSSTTATTTSSLSASPSTSPVKRASVTLQTSALFYQTKDTIAVTLNNQSTQSISFADHQTNCTVILLLRQKVQPQASGNGQPGVNPCRLMTPTRYQSLGSGHQLVIKLVPPASGWPSGLYNVTLNYRPSSATTSMTDIHSPVFTIGSSAPQP